MTFGAFDVAYQDVVFRGELHPPISWGCIWPWQHTPLWFLFALGIYRRMVKSGGLGAAPGGVLVELGIFRSQVKQTFFLN